MESNNIVIQKDIFIINDADKIILVKNNKCVSISKQNFIVQSEEYQSHYERIGTPISGIVGIVDSKDTSFLIAIDKVSLVGTIIENKVYKIESVLYYSFYTKNTPNNANDNQCIESINNYFKRNTLYFSNGYDLSLSNYCLAKNNYVKQNDSNLFSFSNVKFVWNYNNSQKIDNELLKDYLFPIINGFVEIKNCNSYEKNFEYVVISRKEHKRSGCRFIVRGADLNGYTANFSETEQIVVMYNSTSYEYNLYSYLQIRGSVPLIWSQLPNLQLNPPIVLSSSYSENTQAFNRHFTSLINSYDKITIVNLIDKKSYQKLLGDNYNDYFRKFKQTLIISSNNNVNAPKSDCIDYAWFDFHAECKKMKYENIGKLLKTNCVSSALSLHDLSHLVFKKAINNSDDSKEKSTFYKSLNVLSRQNGVFRTNCIDNLDRTNVVQSVFARQFLHKIIYKLKLSDMPHGNPFEEFVGSFESIYRYCWGDNGDIISKAYSGTNALKRDFTRTGKRTIKGSLEDGINTLTRFCINNFNDGYNQDCHDYFLNNLNPRKNTFKNHSTFLVNLLFVNIFILAITFYSVSVSITISKDKDYGIRGVVYKGIIMVGMFMIFSISLMKSFKKKIIDLSTISYY